MFCSNCGSKLNGDEKFCPICGAAVAGVQAQNTPAQNMPVQNTPVQNASPQGVSPQGAPDPIVQNVSGKDGGNGKKGKGSFAKKLAIGVAAVLAVCVIGVAGVYFIGGSDAVEGTFLAKILPQSNKDADGEASGRLTRARDEDIEEQGSRKEQDNADTDRSSGTTGQDDAAAGQDTGIGQIGGNTEREQSITVAEQDFMARAAEAYGTLAENFNPSNMGGELQVSVELGAKGETLLELLGDSVDIDLSGITKAGITAEYKLGAEMAEIGLTAILNKDELLSVDVIYDETNGKLYARIPELDSGYLSFEIPVEEQYLLVMQETISELFTLLPQESEMENIFRTYGDLVTRGIGNFEQEARGSQTLTVAGVSQSCTEVTLKITEESLEALKEEILDQISRDPDLKNIIRRMISSEFFAGEGIDENDVIEEIQYGVEDLFDELEYYVEQEEDQVLEVKYYKDNDRIIGFETELTYRYQVEEAGPDGPLPTKTLTETIPYSVLMAQNGNNIGYYMNLEGEYEITGSGELKNGLLTADFSVKDYWGDENIIISAKDWDIEKMQDMEFSGEFTIAPGSYIVGVYGDEDMLGMFKLRNCKVKVRIDADPEKMDCGVTFVYRDDDYLTANFSWENTHDSRITRPKDLRPIEDEDDLVEWMKTAKWDAAIEKLDRTALPDEVIDLLREMSIYLKAGDLEGLEDYWYGLGGSSYTIPEASTTYY